MTLPRQYRHDLLTLQYEAYDSPNNYSRNQEYYTGSQSEIYASPRIHQLLRDMDYEKFKLNGCASAVDVPLERVELGGLTTGNEALDARLAEVMDENDMAVESKEANRLCALHGSSYMIIMPDEDYTSGVSIYTHSPIAVRAFYHPESPRKMNRALHVYTRYIGDDDVNDEVGLTPGRVYLQAVWYFADRIETYISDNPVDDGRGVLMPIFYETIPMSLRIDEVNPFAPEVPVIHFRTSRANRGFGESFLTPAIGPQVMIDKILTGMMAAVDSAAFRQRYILSDAASSLVDNYSTPADTPTTDADGLTGDSAYEAGPGTVWLLSGQNVKVGQFEATDTKNFLDPVQRLLEWQCRVCDIPPTTWSAGNGKGLSGDSQRQAEIPLIKKCESWTANLDASYRKLGLLILAASGIKSTPVSVTWMPFQKSNDLNFWQGAAIMSQIGVPAVEIFKMSGVAEDVADEWASQIEQAKSPAAPIVIPLQLQSGVQDGNDLNSGQNYQG